MKKPKGYDEAAAVLPGDFKRIAPGGYICKIVKAEMTESKGGREMLVIYYDIAQGEYADHYKAEYENDNREDKKWKGAYYQLTDNERGVSVLKGIFEVIEKSNPGYVWDWEEATLAGKLFGGIFAEEEFEKSDGAVGTNVKLRYFKPVEAIKKGDFIVPDIKRLPDSNRTNGSQGNGAYNAGGEDTPFY